MKNQLKRPWYKTLLQKPIFWEISREILVSIIISAAISAIFTYWFNNKIDQRDANRQYIYNFSRTFFDNSKYRDVSMALEENYLYNKGPIMQADGGKFTDYQIDDYLTELTELYLFGDEGYTSFDLLNDQFGYYVCITYNDSEIQAYGKRLESQGFSNPLGTLGLLANKMGITHQTDCKKISS